MSRRRSKKGTSSGEDPWLILVVVIVMVIASLWWQIVGILVTAGAYGGLIYLVARLANEQSKPVPDMPVADKFDWTDRRNAIATAAGQMRKAEALIGKIYEVGRGRGIPFTKEGDAARFDQRLPTGRKLNIHLEELEKKTREVYNVGRRRGILLTASSDETRFDQRSSEGRQFNTVLEDLERQIADTYEQGKRQRIQVPCAFSDPRFDERAAEASRLNARLDELERVISHCHSRIEHERASIKSSMPAWRSIHSELVERAGRVFAVRVSVVVYGVSLAIFLLATNELSGLSSHAYLAIPPLKDFYGPAALAYATGHLAGWIASLSVRHLGLFEPFAAEKLEAWERLEKEIEEAGALSSDYRPPDSEPNQPGDSEDSGSTEEPDADSSTFADTASSRWFDVLGIAENASPEDIKIAWRRAIQKYHPDNVATLGPKLKELAEKESTAINAAYQHAKKLGKV